MGWKIPLFKIYWDREDIEAVSSAIKSGMYWATGPSVEKFESMISEYLGVKYSVLFNSGTSALHSAMMAHGIKRGDEVIVPSFTFIAAANAPLFVGANPVFADIDEETFGLDPESIREKITGKTKAVIPIHYGGLPCKINEIKEISEENNIFLIEDAAESFGSALGSLKVGSFGDSAVLSFCANKIITTGEGGAIATDSKKIYEKLKLIRSHGRDDGQNNYFSSEKTPDYTFLGFNFRMSNINASLGISQLKKIDKIIDMRKKNADYMNKKLAGIPGLKLHGIMDGRFNVYQLYSIILENEKIRNGLQKHLNDNGIMSKVYFPPVHLTSFYRSMGHREGELAKTEKISSSVLSLPMYPSMTNDEMDFVVKVVGKFFDEKVK